MFCLKCGKEISDGAKFCPFCGAVTSAGGAAEGAGPVIGGGSAVPPVTPPQGPGNSWAPAPEGGNKRRGTGIIIGGAVAAVAVIALIVVLVGGLFSSPKGQVEKALAKTVSAYADAGKKVGLPDLDKLVKDKSYSQRIELELDDINRSLVSYVDLSVLRGLGIRANSDWDQKGKKIDCDVAVVLDGDDVASFQMLANGNNIYVASPEFTGGDVYGLNTETVGADLDRLGAELDEVNLKKIGFDLFDLIEKCYPTEEQNKEVASILSKANKEFLAAVTAEKEGKKTVQVNGKSVDATLYKVTIPEDAMKSYVNALGDAWKVVDSEDMMKEALLSTGLDKRTVNDMVSSMNLDTSSAYKQITSELKDAVKRIGDVELDVYVSGGYVSAVEYSDRIEGTKVEIGLYLGGGSNYVDDLSLEITADDAEITVESSGSHGGDKGVFSDETSIRLRSGRSDTVRLTSELRYEPSAKSKNFQWEVDVDNAGTLALSGQLATTNDSIDLQMDELTLSAMRMELFTLKGSYYMGPCKGMQVSLSGGKMLPDMKKKDLEDLYYDLEENAQEWAEDVAKMIPEDLVRYFRYQF